jgi:PAS domain S-box-containing protein
MTGVSTSPPNLLLLGKIFLLALAYVVSGRLALLLAIPPGFVTAIFPPLGISLAALLLWGNRMSVGVFLGSVALNTNIALNGGASLSMATLMVASEIALGSCLAAGLGAYLIRRYIGFPNDLTRGKDILIFFLVGGPLSACVSASVGVFTLFGNSLLPASGLIYSWLTWWTGDAIGVLIATPFMLIVFGKPRQLWSSRLSGVGVPLLISCALIVIVFFTTSNSEQQKIQRIFQNNAQSLTERVFSIFDTQLNVLVSLKGFFLASNEISNEEFRVFTTTMLEEQANLSALSWNQWVPMAERETFLRNLHNQGFEDFRIWNYDEQQTSTPVDTDALVVTYIEPHTRFGKVQGLNILSEPARARAQAYAVRTGKAAMTAPLHLIQVSEDLPSYIIFLPVYQNPDVPKTEIMRTQLLRGFVVTLMTPGRQIKQLEDSVSTRDFSVSFWDVTDEQNPIEIYNDKQSEISAYTKGFMLESRREIAGRQLMVRILPTPAFVDHNRGLQAWFVLVGGFLFCSLLGAFLLLITGRTQYIRSLVEQRTLELNAILSEAVEAIIIVNSEGIVERANPAAHQLLSFDQQQLVGSRVEMSIPLLGELFKPGAIDRLDDANHMWRFRETTIKRIDGSQVPVEIGVSKVSLPNRKIYTCLIHDITTRKKVDRLKSEFISTVSHELRTPLTSITGVLGLLVGGAVPRIPDKAMDMLVVARHNADRLGRLVNDILDIEKLEFGKLQLDMAEYEVNDLMQQAIEHNSGYAIKYGVHLALDNAAIVGKTIKVSVDIYRFLQVMSNLISNAIKFSNLGGIVTVSARVEARSVVFCVEDQGAGIPEAFRSKIFQKFAQADSSDTRKRDGTGLGLSISRIIVERMGGDINYTTEMGKGTLFYFSIPLVSAPAVRADALL